MIVVPRVRMVRWMQDDDKQAGSWTRVRETRAPKEDGPEESIHVRVASIEAQRIHPFF